MIWPGRRLALALLVPALLSLGLFATEVLWKGVIALDVAIALMALGDLATLLGSSRLRAERRCGAVASLGESQEVELTIENLGRSRRLMRVRDDVPDTFSVDPAEFVVIVPAASLAALVNKVVPRRRGTHAFRRVDALVSSRLGYWQRSVWVPCRTDVRVYPDIRQIARLYRARTPRQAQHAGRPPVSKARHRQRVRAPSRLRRGGRAPPHGLARQRPTSQVDRPRSPGETSRNV